MSTELMKQALAAMEENASHVAQGAPSAEWARFCQARAALRVAIEHAKRPSTHSEDCWKWHHACAIRKILSLAEKNA